MEKELLQRAATFYSCGQSKRFSKNKGPERQFYESYKSGIKSTVVHKAYISQEAYSHIYLSLRLKFGTIQLDPFDSPS